MNGAGGNVGEWQRTGNVKDGASLTDYDDALRCQKLVGSTFQPGPGRVGT